MKSRSSKKIPTNTTHVIFEPLDFIARLASLVPSPRINLTRYHGIFAPHHRLRAQIVPSARGAQKKKGQRALPRAARPICSDHNPPPTLTSHPLG